MRRFITRTTVALALGLGLTLGLAALLGGEAPSAQASLSARSMLAPQPLTTDPAFNALGVPAAADVSVIFNEPISLASVTSRTFVVHGSLSPVFTGTYSLSGLSRTVTLDPARSFFPGERIEAVATTGVRNTAGELATSAVVWHFWAATRGGTGFFVLSSTVGPAGETRSMALGDLDRDGDLDLAVGGSGNPGGQNVVYLNEGGVQGGTPGTFGAISHTVGSGDDMTLSLALGDLDEDGDLDLVAGNFFGQSAIYLNDGDGTFDTISHTVGPGDGRARSLALGDVDGDGDLDLAVGNWNRHNVVYLNDGDGNPFDTITHTVGPGDDISEAVALGDVDGDGDLDLVVGNEEQQNRIYLNDGDGTFDTISRTVGPVNDFTYGLALGDLDGDGDLDLVVGNMGQSAVYLNDGDGTFDTTSYNVGTSIDEVLGVALGDLDGDGDLDLVTANDGPNVVYLNDGGGHPFDTTTHVVDPVSDNTWDVALGDIDGDGDLDLAVGNWVGQDVVYLNREAEVYLPLVMGEAEGLVLSADRRSVVKGLVLRDD